jgi:hypothetical protein
MVKVREIRDGNRNRNKLKSMAGINRTTSIKWTLKCAGKRPVINSNEYEL